MFQTSSCPIEFSKDDGDGETNARDFFGDIAVVVVSSLRRFRPERVCLRLTFPGFPKRAPVVDERRTEGRWRVCSRHLQPWSRPCVARVKSEMASCYLTVYPARMLLPFYPSITANASRATCSLSVAYYCTFASSFAQPVCPSTESSVDSIDPDAACFISADGLYDADHDDAICKTTAIRKGPKLGCLSEAV